MSIKETLINKIICYPSHQIFDNNGDYLYLTDFDSNGYFSISKTRCAYLSYVDGLVHQLTVLETDSNLHEIEYQKHLLLYELGENVRIDIPIHMEKFHAEHKSWVYTIVKRPNKQLGTSFYIESWLTGKNPLPFIEEAIIEHTKMLSLLPKVTEQLGDGVPKYCNPIKYLRDDKGLFLSNFKKWACPISKFMEVQYNELRYEMNGWNARVPPDLKLDVDSVIAFAEDTWKNIKF